MFNLFLIVIFFAIVIGISFFRKTRINKQMKVVASERMLNIEMIKHFDSYVAVLEYHMVKAYEIIFKDQIMIYSVEAMGIDEEHFSEASKKFIRLVLKMIGPNLQQEFEYLYGSRDTLFFNIAEYFNRRYEEDEVRKTAQGNLIKDEEN